MSPTTSTSPAGQPSPQGGFRRHAVWPAVISCLWVLLAVTGMFGLERYAGTPGAQSPSPRHWPAQSKLSFDHSRPTLVIFVHPQCGCSKASIAELEKLMTRCHGSLSAWVIFLHPA